jgi:PPM family protein phosphatase
MAGTRKDGGVRLLTIGAFARAARLTPKALRLYDDVGLLPPAAVDPESGYRYYDPGQLDRARLIAALRRVGMPLAEIRTVCDLEPADAAGAVRAYWDRVSADTAERGRAAILLVDLLSGRSTTMSPTTHLRTAARCETGAVRDSNEDAVYASDRLLAVADGMRGPGGAVASTAAIDTLTGLDPGQAKPAELLTMLADAVARADAAVRGDAVDGHHPVTTLTAVLRSGSQLALVHVGDTRAYLLRDGEVHRLTQDHRYDPSSPLLVRALGAGTPVEADLALRTARDGDRYLLCSDGLWSVVDPAEALRLPGDPRTVVDRLVDLAYAAGAPDNIACVVADLVTG